MYFNRKGAKQTNWRMIKKGKHFLFGCSLVLALGATTNVAADTSATQPASENDTAINSKPEDGLEATTKSTEVATYQAPAVDSTIVAEAESAKTSEENPTSSEQKEVASEKAETPKAETPAPKVEEEATSPEETQAPDCCGFSYDLGIFTVFTM